MCDSKEDRCYGNWRISGQVASQTAEALVVTDSVVKTPVMRPLIAMDKVDIMDKAKEIGTYDISIQPYEGAARFSFLNILLQNQN